MKTILYFYAATVFILSIFACNKEFSFEANNNAIAKGTFDCNSFDVHGDYIPNSKFTDSNCIHYKINITSMTTSKK